MAKQGRPWVLIKCVGCGSEKKITPGPTQPFCEYCGSPVIAVKASR